MKSTAKTIKQAQQLRGAVPRSSAALERRIQAEKEWSKKQFYKGIWQTAQVISIVVVLCAVVKAITVVNGWTPFYVG